MNTIVDAVRDRRAGSGTLTTIEPGGGTRVAGWDQVHDRARRLASVMTDRGIGPGARIGLLADTSLELVALIQAVWLNGGAITVLPLPVRQAPDAYAAQLRRVAADAGLDVAVVGPPLDGVRGLLTGSVPTAALDDLVRTARTAEPAEPVTVRPEDLAILQYTSGSTRDPQGVPVTHRHLAANIQAVNAATGDRIGQGILFSWLPLYHDMGLIGFLAMPMWFGCPLILQSPLEFLARPLGWLEGISTHGATATAAPNFAWALAARLLAGTPAPDPAMHLGSLRLALTGGEPIDPAMMRRFLDAAAPHGLDPGVMACAYGLAEATLAVTLPRPGAGMTVDVVAADALETTGRAVPVPVKGAPPRGVRTLARVGPPIPGARVRIVDTSTDAELAERQVGGIEVSGPSVIDSYWGQAPTGTDGWLRTGDLGYLAEGELVVCGREKDLLFAAGRNVFPQDAEAAAGALPAVRTGNAVAFGVPGGIRGDRLVIAVESRSWADAAVVAALRTDVALAVTTQMGLSPVAVPVLPPGRLPKTSSGKLRRAETRRQYLAGQLDLFTGFTRAEPTAAHPQPTPTEA